METATKTQIVESKEVERDMGALLPQLESWERMMKLPVVEKAWGKGQDVYGKVKGKFIFINFSLIEFKLI